LSIHISKISPLITDLCLSRLFIWIKKSISRLTAKPGFNQSNWGPISPHWDLKITNTIKWSWRSTKLAISAPFRYFLRNQGSILLLRLASVWILRKFTKTKEIEFLFLFSLAFEISKIEQQKQRCDFFFFSHRFSSVFSVAKQNESRV